MTSDITRRRSFTPSGKPPERRLRISLLAAALLAAGGMQAARADGGERSLTGEALLQRCTGASADAAWCDAYITGVVEGMFGARTFPARCFKDRPRLGDMKKVIVQYAEWSNLEDDDYSLRRPAPLMIQNVLTVRYCD